MHENLLHLRYFDASLTRTAAVLSHMADADVLLRACHRGSGSGGLLRYLPAALVQVRPWWGSRTARSGCCQQGVSWQGERVCGTVVADSIPSLLLLLLFVVQASNLVAGHERPQLQWPRTVGEAWRAATANAALLASWRLRMSAEVAAATAPAALVSETLPALLHIAGPALRPVSQHLYSREEQAAVHGLVDTLLSLGLRFVAEGRGGGGLQELGQQLGFAAQHTQRQQQLQGGGGGGGGAAAEARAALAGSRDEPPMQFRPAVHRLATYPVSTAPAHWLQLIVL